MSYFADIRIKKDLEMMSIQVERCRLDGRVLHLDIFIKAFLYEGMYKFQIIFSEKYPFVGPKVKCLTRTFHPNIDEDGNVCLKILREGWMPSYTIDSIVGSIILAFEYLEWEDALNTEAGDLLRFNKSEFEKRVKRQK